MKFLSIDGVKTLWTKVKTELGKKSDVGHTHDYLPLTGGEITGDLTTDGNVTVKGKTITVGDCDIVYDNTNKCVNFTFK